MKIRIKLIIIVVIMIFSSCGKKDSGPTGPGNTAPVLTEIADQTVNAGDTENVDLSATDADGDSLSFSIPTNPGFLSISGFSQTGNTANATLVIAPEGTLSGTFNVAVQVSDGNGGVDRVNFTIEVQQIEITPGEWTGNNMEFYVSSDGDKLTGTGSTLSYGASMIVTIPIQSNPYGVSTITFYKYTDIPIHFASFNYNDGEVEVDGEFSSEFSAWGTSSCAYYNSHYNYTFIGSGTWNATSTSYSPPTEYLRSVYFTNSNIGWIVGFSGTILKTTDGGNSWSQQTSGTEQDLYSVYFVDASTGWVVGCGSTILKTINGGESWVQQYGVGTDNLRSVCFANANTGWTVGNYNKILKTTNGGSDWSPQSSGINNHFRSVFFVDTNTGWIAGYDGTILKTTDGGSSWTPQNSGTSYWLQSVYFTSSNTGWIVGRYGTILKTTDGGNNWVTQTSGTGNSLHSTYFINSNTGWAAGYNGTILKTTNSGSNWTTQSSGTANTLRSVFFIDSNNGWIVGAEGTILKTTNGGSSWFQG